MKKLLIKKRKGQGDLIASLFVLLALTLFVFFFIHSIGDVNTRINLDQVARKYILRMESSGSLTAEEMEQIKTECNQIKSVKIATGGSNSPIKVSYNGTNTSTGYGGTITLEIRCPVAVTTYSTEGTFVGKITKNKDNVVEYVITKQSTAKY